MKKSQTIKCLPLLTVFALFFLTYNVNSLGFSTIDSQSSPDLLSYNQHSINVLSTSNNSGKIGNIYVIVNFTIFNSINDSLNQYIEDAEIMGYNVTLISWSSSNVTELRSTLENGYSNGLLGAVLVGDLPHATYYLPANASAGFNYNDYFPCDLFLMDLNGTWSYNSTHKAYTDHTGHISPEIWVARINPTPLIGQNQTDLYVKYFDRNHRYKNGSLTRPHNALLYIDDTWASSGNEWKTDIQYAYTNTTMFNGTHDILVPTHDFHYEGEIQKDYEWVWVLVHSNSTHHYWDNEQPFPLPPVTEYTNYSEIRSIDPNALFYNLYACYAANYNDSNNLGTQYLFGNYSLAVVGSTKTGGMLWTEDFYKDLNNNYTLGYSFLDWFCTSPRGVVDTYNSYGIILTGDPLLTIHHDVTVFPPTISSSTHPDQTKGYDLANVTLNWTVPDDISGIDGFYIALDQNINTNPSMSGAWVINTSIIYTNLANGTYYFHIVAKDKAGCLSTLVHYTFNVVIIVNPPMIDHPDDVTYTEGTTGHNITWHPTASLPENFTVYYNGSFDSSDDWNGSSIILYVDSLSVGWHNYTLIVCDSKGNTASDDVLVIVVPVGGIDTTSPTINHPTDISYTEGETGNSITWIPSDDHPANYSLYLNGSLEKSDDWTDGNIIYDIDGLSPGIYNYTLVVFDESGNSNSDTVIVTVNPTQESSSETSTSSKSTTSDKPSDAISGFTTIMIFSGLIVVFAFRRRN